MDARLHGPARVARLQVVGMAESDNRCAEVQAKLLAALLPPPEVEVQPTRICGVAGRSKAHLLDAARLIDKEWEATSASSIVHCWVKSTILPPLMSALLMWAHAEYTGGFDSVGRDVNEVLAHLNNTTIGVEAVSGEIARDVREGVRLCFVPRMVRTQSSILRTSVRRLLMSPLPKNKWRALTASFMVFYCKDTTASCCSSHSSTLFGAV